MNILVCIKRVPAPGARIVLTEDEQAIETRFLKFAISPHEECAVEEAVQQIAKHGGEATALALGGVESEEQLRYTLAMGMNKAVLLESDGGDWGPMAIAKAIADAVEAHDRRYDAILFGTESADNANYQVGVRVAHALDLPCVVGIKSLEFDGDKAIAQREVSDGWEVFEVDLPAIFTVKEGINLPRYPSVRGRLRAKKAQIERHHPSNDGEGLQKVRLRVPETQGTEAEILGNGPSSAPKVAALIKELGLLD